jgi:hypothetical protein
MFKIILGILGNALGGLAGWMQKYADPKNTEARRMSEENKAKDQFNSELKNKDIDSIRRDLS